jgi:beta-glucosidase
VVQLYVGFPADANEPPQQLKGFDKVTLAPGESKIATFVLNRGSFSAWDELTRHWKVFGGTYTVNVGRNRL